MPTIIQSLQASNLPFDPTGDVAAANVQAAIAELDSEKLSTADIHAATSKTAPVAADELLLVDNEAGFVLKKIMWATLLATIHAAALSF